MGNSSYFNSSYCDFVFLFILIIVLTNITLPNIYHYLTIVYVEYFFIHLCIESQRLATFRCWCYLFYNVIVLTKNKIFLSYSYAIRYCGSWSSLLELTHCGLVMPYGYKELGQIGSANGLYRLFHTPPFPEPIAQLSSTGFIGTEMHFRENTNIFS